MAYIYNGGFELKNQKVKTEFVSGRPSSVSLTVKPNITKSINANAKPRLYQPKTAYSSYSSVNSIDSINTNNNKSVSTQKNIKKPPIDVKSVKGDAIVKEKKSHTFFERLTEIENTFKTTIEQFESQIFDLANEAILPQQTIDEANIYCNKTETRTELLKFYNEVVDVTNKLNTKRDALLDSKTNFLNALHEYSCFLSGNFMPFKETMDLRLKKIQEIVAAQEAAEKEEEDRIKLNPSLKLIETKDQEVQVRPELLINFSPTASINRRTTSTIKQRIVMPTEPILKTEFTPTSTLYGSFRPTIPRSTTTFNESVCDVSVISALPN